MHDTVKLLMSTDQMDAESPVAVDLVATCIHENMFVIIVVIVIVIVILFLFLLLLLIIIAIIAVIIVIIMFVIIVTNDFVAINTCYPSTSAKFLDK